MVNKEESKEEKTNDARKHTSVVRVSPQQKARVLIMPKVSYRNFICRRNPSIPYLIELRFKLIHSMLIRDHKISRIFSIFLFQIHPNPRIQHNKLQINFIRFKRYPFSILQLFYHNFILNMVFYSILTFFIPNWFILCF